MRKDRELLEDLKELAGCMYISDLRSAWRHPLLQKILREIAPEQYTAAQWQELISYICDQHTDVPTAAEGRQYLLHWLQAHDHGKS